MSNTKPAKTAAPAAAGGTVKQFLASKKATLAQYLEGTALTPERLLNVVMSEVRNTPALQDCDQASLFAAITQSAQLGLEPGSALGHCYLIPFKNRQKQITEVQFMLGYRGMIELARRSGEVLALAAREVRENDEFRLVYGLHEDLIHVPLLNGDRGEVIGYYAVAQLKDGGYQFDFMDMNEIAAVKSRSKSAGSASSPWQSDPIAMGKKSVVRRMFKFLPVSITAQRAVAEEELSDRGVVIDGATGEIESKQPAATASAAALNDMLG